jgi:hypothetical protein
MVPPPQLVAALAEIFAGITYKTRPPPLVQDIELSRQSQPTKMVAAATELVVGRR